MTIHILKLCVGVDSVEHLQELRAGRAEEMHAGRPYHYHITRSFPRRAAEVLEGGSLYWVIKGFVQARQKIIGLETVKTDTGKKCMIMMDTELIRTEAQPRRPHQGWRYLEPKDAPKDLPQGTSIEELPTEMSAELRALGLL